MKNKITIFNLILCIIVLGGCKPAQEFYVYNDGDDQLEAVSSQLIWNLDNQEKIGSMEIEYATTFTVDYYEPGYALITINDTDRYLYVGQGEQVPVSVEDGIRVINGPIDNIYMASSSSMDYFRTLGCLDRVSFTSTKRENWSVLEVLERLDDGRLEYIGKYNMPDYELLVSSGCNIAIENTMVYHCPEVKENIEALGIPVIVDYSSYETSPLGRLEYVKLYGLLLGKEDEAMDFFEESEAAIAGISFDTEKIVSVGYFYIASGGHVNVRKPGDYVTKMIEIAGGSYALNSLVPEEENALATMNIQMESFYENAVDADILIYNSTTTGDVHSILDLLAKEPLMGDFAAVRNGQVWCTTADTFQRTSAAADMIRELNLIFEGKAPDSMEFFYRLQ